MYKCHYSIILSVILYGDKGLISSLGALIFKFCNLDLRGPCRCSYGRVWWVCCAVPFMSRLIMEGDACGMQQYMDGPMKHEASATCCAERSMEQSRMLAATGSESSRGVVVRNTGAYEKLSGHLAGPVLGWVPEMSARFWATTPARLSGLDSENRSHGSPSSFGRDIKSRSLLPSALF